MHTNYHIHSLPHHPAQPHAIHITPPPPSGSNYREIFAHLCGMLPPYPDDTPDTRAARHKSAMDAVEALIPADAFEARLAARIVAMDDHAADCLRLTGLAAADPDKMRSCRAQAASMARQSDAALRSLQRLQATREKQEAALHPAAMERAGYWFRDISVLAPPPDPAPPAEADPFSQLSEADRYAVMYPDRAVRIRAAGGLPADLDFGAREPELVPDIVHGTSPILLALDRQRLNGTAKPARVVVSATASHATVL